MRIENVKYLKGRSVVINFLGNYTRYGTYIRSTRIFFLKLA